MENLYLSGGKHIPEINFDANSGIFSISGQSYHEHAEEFYAPVLAWLREFFREEGKKAVVNMKFTYFNTASSRSILDILEILEKYEAQTPGSVTVNWFYKESDYDMFESGEDYQADVDIKINLISY
jgi:hypothetical protein